MHLIFFISVFQCIFVRICLVRGVAINCIVGKALRLINKHGDIFVLLMTLAIFQFSVDDPCRRDTLRYHRMERNYWRTCSINVDAVAVPDGHAAVQRAEGDIGDSLFDVAFFIKYINIVCLAISPLVIVCSV